MTTPQPSLIFATHNAHKLEEVSAMLSDTGTNLLGLRDINFNEEIHETGDTLRNNASIKSQTIHEATGQSVFSDDSGLEVLALGMDPGVLTARYAGAGRDNMANMEKLLSELSSHSDRTARFRTVISLIWAGEEHFFEGIVNGRIAMKQEGEKGFGYDPIFIPYGYDRTFAQLPSDVKNGMSHRYRAICQMQRFLLTKL